MSRRATNLSLNAELLDEARDMNLNLSKAAEEGIRRAVEQEKARQWLAENAEAMEEWRVFVEKNGLPLAKYRKF